MIDKIIKFEQDTAERKQWFTATSFSHPAKMHLSLQMYLIEHYTKRGDTILDPMTGSGTILVACALERNVICVELEEKFVKMQKDNWEKIKSLGPMLGYKMGKAVILQGDARNLDNLLVDKCIFSPPYEGTIAQGGNTGAHKAKYGYQGENIGYTKPHPTIRRLRKHGRTDDKAGGPYGRSLGHPYSGAAENIGNLKSENYLEAMLQVYRQCHKVLKPKGLLILVTKNFIRDKKIVPLDLDTIKLCEQAGFTLIERLKRKLTQMSFWRRIYQQKYPDAPTIDFEDVLIFEREGKK